MVASEKHNELACLGLTWLQNKVTRKGMRGTTEVRLDQGYVADAVALCSLQSRFFENYCKHSNLKPINYFACLFEAKATRADFLSTFGSGPNHQNRHQPIGSLHWCVTPKKLINPDELPDFWGLLEEYGTGLREIKKPKINILNAAKLDKIAHQLLWPLQARRNHIICQKCGRWIFKGYCKRCSWANNSADVDG